MGEMTMNRAIHGAVRRDLDRFVGALRGFTSGDQKRADRLGRAWSHFEAQLNDHHEGEHAIAWPAMRKVGVADELLVKMDAEHEQMAAAMSRARTAIGALARSPGRAETDAALTAFEHLRTVTVHHLDHEEAELEPVMLTKHDDPAIRQMSKDFSKGGVARGGALLTWVLDGASPDEGAAVTRSIPGPVVAVATAIFGRGYRRDIASVWSG